MTVHVETEQRPTRAGGAPGGGASPKARPPRAPYAVGIGALVLALILIAFTFLDWNLLRGPLSRFASGATGRRVEIVGDLKVHLLTFTPTVEIGGLRIGEPAWEGKGDFAKVARIKASARLWPLLTGRVVMPLLELDQPDIALLRDASGRENWRLGSGKPSAHPFKLPPIERFIVDGGRIRYLDVEKRLSLNGTVDSNERATGPQSHAFSLLGSGSVNKEPFALKVSGGPLLNVDLSKPYPFNADVRAGATHVLAAGELSRPFDTTFLTARLSVQGQDLSNLYSLTGLALPNTPPYRFQGTLTRRDRTYVFDRAAGRFGASDVEGRIEVQLPVGRHPDLTADLRSKTLDVKDLASLLGARPTSAPKAAAKAATVRGDGAGAGSGRLLPDAPLEAARLKSMDARLTYRADTVSSGFLPIKGASLDLVLKDGILHLQPVAFSFPLGRVVGDISIDANLTPPLTRADVRFNRLNLDELIPQKGPNPPIEGVLAARIKVEGRGASVHQAAAHADGAASLVVPSGRMRQAFAELLGVNAGKGLTLLLQKNKGDTGLRCGVAAFGIRQGVMRVQTLVLDTDVVKVQGQGSVDLGDERLDLTLKGDTKKFRIGHVFLPITVGGSLSHPELGVKPAPALAQGAAAAALGAVFPLAAILPFIDPGLAKDADCGALLAQERTGSAPVTPAQGAAAPKAKASGRKS